MNYKSLINSNVREQWDSSVDRLTICVLATDLTPYRRAFLGALLDSIAATTPKSALSRVLIIGQSHVDIKLPDYVDIFQICSEMDFLGSSFPIVDVPGWYVEQILALAVSASLTTDFTLMLPIGSFVIRPLDISQLLPYGKALTSYECTKHHSDWWAEAGMITQRAPQLSSYGPTILPAILSRELAVWTLEIIKRETGRDPLSVLAQISMELRPWSAMSLYATASGSRFTSFHRGFDGSGSGQQLLSSHLFWAESSDDNFDPAAAARQGDPGILTYVDSSRASRADTVDIILDRLYCCLMRHDLVKTTT